MSLWIRIQDKEMLMNCNAVGIGLEDDKSIYSNGYVLGTYSSKEKALKVLDMIQTRICSIKKLELIGNILNVSSPSEIAFNEEDKFVFQMPQDSEVE